MTHATRPTATVSAPRDIGRDVLGAGPDAESGSLELCQYLHSRYKGGFKADVNRGGGTVHDQPALEPLEAFDSQVSVGSDQARCCIDLLDLI